MRTIKFRQWECVLKPGVYAADNKVQSLQLVDAHDGSPIAMATCYHNQLLPGELGIKDWSENEGMYNTLVEADVIHPYHRTIASGYVEILVCKPKELA